MYLAAECEWKSNVDCIFEDFCKLTDLKAPIKVMVCEPPHKYVADVPEADS